MEHLFEQGKAVQARNNPTNQCGVVYTLLTINGFVRESAYRIRFPHGIAMIREESLESCEGNAALVELHSIAEANPHLGRSAQDRFFNLIRLVQEHTWDEVLAKVKIQQAQIR